MEKAVLSKAMSANNNYDSPNYTSRDLAKEVAQRVNSQFAHYGDVGSTDYLSRMAQQMPIGNDGANAMDGYRRNKPAELDRLKENYRDPVQEMLMNSLYNLN